MKKEKNNQKKHKLINIFTLTFFLFISLTAYSQTGNQNNSDKSNKQEEKLFRFKFIDGESYKIHSIVNERVYVDNKYHHSAEILNRITADISDVKDSDGLSTALFNCSFMTSEKNSNQTYNWSKQYPSVFRRDARGFYEIEDKYFMPVVRDIPTFPKESLKPGDTWQGEGHEAHDFRDAFGIEKPFIIPFKVEYQYIGEKEIDGKIYSHITASYNLDYTVPDELLRKYKKDTYVPIRTLGNSKQNLYWDNERGNLVLYNEEFHIKLILYSGIKIDFIGNAEAKLIQSKKIKEKETKELKEDIDKLNLENTNVKKTDEGLTISLEKIKFLPDSAELLDSEKEKIKKIVEVLSKFSDKEFLVSGHTALAGTKRERQDLSEERANVVANYLIELGLQKREHIYTRGLGARMPLVPNTSPDNKAKNRRVEITILD